MTARPAMLLPIVAGLLAAAAAPQRGDRDQALLDKALAGRSAGAPQHCLEQIDVSEIETHRDTILYKQGRRTTWLNRVRGNCAGLAHGDIVVTQSIQPGRYCAGDIVRTRASTGGALTGACTLGEFVPYRR